MVTALFIDCAPAWRHGTNFAPGLGFALSTVDFSNRLADWRVDAPATLDRLTIVLTVDEKSCVIECDFHEPPPLACEMFRVIIALREMTSWVESRLQTGLRICRTPADRRKGMAGPVGFEPTAPGLPRSVAGLEGRCFEHPGFRSAGAVQAELRARYAHTGLLPISAFFYAPS